MSNEPILSVIIPVYNTDKYLRHCLDSVINQSLKNLEILIVDDQSDDGSPAIIKEYAARFQCISIFRTTHKSLAGGARNLGVSKAKGKYIGFVDSDDWIDTDMYLQMTNLLEQSSADIGVCGVIKEYEHSYDAFYKYNYKFENILEGKFAFQLLAPLYNQGIAISPIACNKIYRRSFLDLHHFTFLPNNYNEDDAFNYLCFLHAGKVAITPNTYYHYYQRHHSITHFFSRKHIDDLLEAFRIIKEHLDQTNLFKVYKNHYFSFFERCAAFVFNLLIQNEPDLSIQNEYMQYFFANTKSNLNLLEYFEYCGAQRIRGFFNPSPIK